MARPPKSSEPLTKKVTVRMTQADYDRYLEILQNAQAGNKKYTASDFIRDAIYNRPPPEIVTRKVTSGLSQCDRDRVRMLSNTTNNINQIARAINRALRYEPQYLHKIINDLEVLSEYVRSELC